MSNGRDQRHEGGLLDRWAERKRRVAEERQRETAEPSEAELASGAASDESPESPPPRPLTDADMPPLDSLDESSDYSGFLSPEVSEGLRRAALRKLFSSAGFNVCDGLDDYAEDFTSFEPLGDLVTWDMRAQQRREAERAAAAEAEAEAEAEAGAAQIDPAAADGDGDGDEGATSEDEAETESETESDQRAAGGGEPLPAEPGDDDTRGGRQ